MKRLFLLSLISLAILSFQTAPTVEKSATLTVLINSTNHFFYYEGTLRNDASNLKAAREEEIPAVIQRFKKQNKRRTLEFVVRVLDETTLDQSSRNVIALVSAETNSRKELMTETEYTATRQLASN